MPRSRPRAVLLVVAGLAVALSGCAMLEDLLGSGEDVGDDALTVEQKPVESEDVAADLAAGSEDDSEDRQTEEASDGEEAVPVLDLDLPGITLLSATAGEGQRPFLRWEAVAEADSYLVVLRDGVEAPASWVWRGRDLEVQVGFGERLGIGGPEVRSGMVWSVLALDDEGVPVAQSQERPIGP